MSDKAITHLFLDIGGVLLTNGWDRDLRKRVASHFGIDQAEMDERHHLTYDTYEQGEIGLDVYLNRVMFYQPRSFSMPQVVDFILNQAKPFEDMLDLMRRLKAKHGLKVVVVSNEGRELAVDRIRRFKLDSFVDFFVVSAFVHIRKPDEDIWRIALDISQAAPERVAYVDDRRMFVEVGGSLGLRAIWHTSVASTQAALAEMGLSL